MSRWFPSSKHRRRQTGSQRTHSRLLDARASTWCRCIPFLASQRPAHEEVRSEVSASFREADVNRRSTGVSIRRLRGLTQDGGTFIFAENRRNLTAADVAQADAALNANGGIVAGFAPGNYAGIEWAGACFHERWMFVNIQSPGITFAITGPWDNGAL